MPGYALWSLHLILAAYRGWGWGWWWWWWFWIVIFFIWLLFLPPFGWGRRWYAGYRGAGGVSPDIDLADRWQTIESRFVSAPAASVLEADDLVTRMLAARRVRPDTIAAYRDAPPSRSRQRPAMRRRTSCERR